MSNLKRVLIKLLWTVMEAFLHNMLTEKDIYYAEDETSHWVVGFGSAIERQKECNTCETSLKKQTSKVFTRMQMPSGNYVQEQEIK